MTAPERAHWDFADDPPPKAEIDLEKFQRVLMQGSTARAQLDDLSGRRQDAYNKLQKLKVELENHPYSAYARFPPRAGLTDEIATAKLRLEFLTREMEKVRPPLLSRVVVARACAEYARRRGITADLERKQSSAVSIDLTAYPGSEPAASPASPADAPPIVPDSGAPSANARGGRR